MNIAIAEPWKRPWPSDGLEALGACPVCKTPDRALLHDDLVDNTFFCAPGQWALWRCAACRSAYLDPRPTPDTIQLAYATYFTHSEAGGEPRRPASLRGWLVENYRWGRMGRRAPASVLADLLIRLRPRLRRSADYGLRYLPPVRRGGNRLLDVGCGNGAFLATARGFGWNAAGCDFDAAAVERARTLGFEVSHGGPEAIDDGEGFDYVTLSHVIEHVHSPVEFLRGIRRLMKPSARIFIDTPNAGALGFERFGRYWRGLEAPRHLALFTWDGLESALAEAGFGDLVRHPQPQVCHAIWSKSARMRAGFSPYDEQAVLPEQAMAVPPPQAQIDADRSEFVTVTGAVRSA